MHKRLNIENLRTAMERAGLNAAGIAKELRVSREAVSNWLSSEAFPRPDKLLKLALRLGLDLDQLVVKGDPRSEPVVAFRKRGATKTTERHIAHAKEMGHLLKPLVPYLPFDELIRPATLKQPVLDYAYLQRVAAKVRGEIGVTPTEPITFRHLIKRFAELQAVLIPVLWGEKEKHENALHIRLPDSMTTWVYLNLDSETHDFKFWMAHELGHLLAPSLTADEGEDFADAFAGALLLPEPLAEAAYDHLSSMGRKGVQVNTVKEIAEDNTISPISVYYEINRFARHQERPKIDLEPGIYGAAQNLNKQYHTVSEAFFRGQAPSPKDYIAIGKEEFASPFFDALKDYLVEHHKAAGYVQSILDIPLLDAKAIHAALS